MVVFLEIRPSIFSTLFEVEELPGLDEFYFSETFGLNEGGYGDSQKTGERLSRSWPERTTSASRVRPY